MNGVPPSIVQSCRNLQGMGMEKRQLLTPYRSLEQMYDPDAIPVKKRFAVFGGGSIAFTVAGFRSLPSTPYYGAPRITKRAGSKTKRQQHHITQIMKQGMFEISLVDHADQRVFQEHYKSKTNETYAEVEHSREYTIRIRSHCPKAVSVTLQVDGTTLVQRLPLQPGAVVTQGIWEDASERNGFVSTMRALKFAAWRAGGNNQARNQHLFYLPNESSSQTEFWTGQVQAQFYGRPRYRIPEKPDPQNEKKKEGKIRKEVTNPSDGAGDDDGLRKVKKSRRSAETYDLGSYQVFPLRMGRSISCKVGYREESMGPSLQKGVKSDWGTAALQSHVVAPVPPPPRPVRRTLHPWFYSSVPRNRVPLPRVEDAVWLGSLTLHYCSAEGLIHAGILRKPRDWDRRRLQKQSPRCDNWRELSEAKVQYIPDGYRDSRTGQVYVTGHKELFDLTAEPDEKPKQARSLVSSYRPRWSQQGSLHSTGSPFPDGNTDEEIGQFHVTGHKELFDLTAEPDDKPKQARSFASRWSRQGSWHSAGSSFSDC